MANIMRLGGGSGGKPKMTASLTPKDGVTYISGVSDLYAATMNEISEAISSNPDITDLQSVVYYDNGDVHRKISVGDRATLLLNGTSYAFDIIGFNHDTLTDANAYGRATATGKAGITLQINKLFGTKYKMNNTSYANSSGGWRESDMRMSTMATVQNYMPADWQSVIKAVNKSSGTGSGSTSGTEVVSDNCFLLSEVEVFNTLSNSVSGEGNQYAYYRAGNSRVKKYGTGADYWWLRSPAKGVSGKFCIVGNTGAILVDVSYSQIGVAFAFCI